VQPDERVLCQQHEPRHPVAIGRVSYFTVRRQSGSLDRRRTSLAPAGNGLFGDQIESALNAPDFFTENVAPDTLQKRELARQRVGVCLDRCEEIRHQSLTLQAGAGLEEPLDLLEDFLELARRLESSLKVVDDTPGGGIPALQPEEEKIQNEALVGRRAASPQGRGR
jgi:hypothetical protein